MGHEDEPKTELAVVEPALSRNIRLSELQTLAKSSARSNYFGITEDQALAKMIVGHELGWGAGYSIMNIDVIEGKLSVKPAAMAGHLKKSGKYDYKVIKCDDKGAEIEFLEREVAVEGDKVQSRWKAIGTSRWDEKEAKQAGLIDKKGSNYKRYPSDMYFNRAMSRGIRRYCPDLFSTPVYCDEELRPLDVDKLEAKSEPKVQAARVRLVGDVAKAPPPAQAAVDAVFVAKPEAVAAVKEGLARIAADEESLRKDAAAAVKLGAAADPKNEFPPEAEEDLLAVDFGDAKTQKPAEAIKDDPLGYLLCLFGGDTGLAQKIHELKPDDRVSETQVKDIHGHVTQASGSKDAALAAWEAVGVVPKKGAVVTKDHVTQLSWMLYTAPIKD